MAVVYRRCAGLDVHRDKIAVCVRIRVNGKYEEHHEVFGSFTDELKKLARWLKERKVRRVAMESTGVYWIPVWNVLEKYRYRFDLLLVNPAQVRAMNGHKTDKIDCARIAEFLQHGRLAGSFIPPAEIREARGLQRRRVHLQQDRNRVTNRIGRLLQTANIKLSSVLSNIVGVSGERMLRAIAAGEEDGKKLAELAHYSLEGKKENIRRSFEGRYDPHFRYLLNELLSDLDHLDRKLDSTTARLAQYMEPHLDLVKRLCTIPGIDKVVAWTIISEIGSDVSAFPDAKHLASWAALCPGNNESAGKRKSGRTNKGNKYLRRALVQAAWAAGHSKNTFLSALFFRISRRHGMKKAAVAVAHRLLVYLYHVIRDGGSYVEKGGDYFDRLHPERTAQRLLARLESLDYDTSRIIRKVPPAEAVPLGSLKPGRGRPCKCAERGMPCFHQKSVSVCIRRRVKGSSEPETEEEVFGTFTRDLLRLRKWLRERGVHFEMNTRVTDLTMRGKSVGKILYSRGGVNGEVVPAANDLVIVTLGSMTDSSTLGSMDAAPVLNANPGAAWSLWEKIAANRPEFGRPSNFASHIDQSRWVSFTATLHDPALFRAVRDFTGNIPGEGGLITFADSAWLMSIVLPHQPHFIGQPEDVNVLWGYGLSVDKRGDFVTKPMSACSGREIMTELLSQLRIKAEAAQILRTSTCIPCMMPFITSQFMPREKGDRLQIVPQGWKNFAFIGQYCEIPDDVVFTVEYSIRSAQTAVYQLLGIKREPPSVYKGQYDPRVLYTAFRTLHGMTA
jgi:transposase